MLETLRQVALAIFRPSSGNGGRAKASQVSQASGHSLAAAADREAKDADWAAADLPLERLASQIEEELDYWKRKLTGMLAALEHQSQNPQRPFTRSNQPLIEIQNHRAQLLETRIEELNADLDAAQRGQVHIRLSELTKHTCTQMRREARASPPSLGRAARDVLKRGRLLSSSERAVVAERVTDLEGDDPELQAGALDHLNKLKSRGVLPILEAAMEHADERVRLTALRSVSLRQDSRARDLLIQALSDESHQVRACAMRSLFDLGDPSLIEHLCRMLYDPHPQARRMAATYLDWNRSRMAEPCLKDCLFDESPEVRVVATRALGHCGTAASVFRLLSVLTDEEKEVREAAAAALRELLDSTDFLDAVDCVDGRDEAAHRLKVRWKTERVQLLLAGDKPFGTPEVTSIFEQEGSDCQAGDCTKATNTDEEPGNQGSSLPSERVESRQHD